MHHPRIGALPGPPRHRDGLDRLPRRRLHGGPAARRSALRRGRRRRRVGVPPAVCRLRRHHDHAHAGAPRFRAAGAHAAPEDETPLDAAAAASLLADAEAAAGGGAARRRNPICEVLSLSVCLGLASVALSGSVVATPTRRSRTGCAGRHGTSPTRGLFFCTLRSYTPRLGLVGWLVDRFPDNARAYKTVTALGFVAFALTFELLAPIGLSAGRRRRRPDAAQAALNNLPTVAVAMVLKGVGSALSNNAVYPDLVLGLPPTTRCRRRRSRRCGTRRTPSAGRRGRCSAARSTTPRWSTSSAMARSSRPASPAVAAAARAAAAVAAAVAAWRACGAAVPVRLDAEQRLRRLRLGHRRRLARLRRRPPRRRRVQRRREAAGVDRPSGSTMVEPLVAADI